MLWAEVVWVLSHASLYLSTGMAPGLITAMPRKCGIVGSGLKLASTSLAPPHESEPE